MQSWDLFERKSCEYTNNISSTASSKNKTFLVSSLSSFAKNKQKNSHHLERGCGQMCFSPEILNAIYLSIQKCQRSGKSVKGIYNVQHFSVFI